MNRCSNEYDETHDPHNRHAVTKKTGSSATFSTNVPTSYLYSIASDSCIYALAYSCLGDKD